MKTYKIVFTGGPCGGKTDIITKVAQYLESLNYKVILLPETARLVMAAGIKANPSDKKYTLWFQDSIIKFQALKEKIAEEYQDNYKNLVILYDRSIPDNFAYLNNYKDYKNLLNKNNLNELNIIDKYDLVINLSSLSNFKNFDYKNDEERNENHKLAKYLDYKTSIGYLLSRNLKIIYPTKDIEEKELIIIDLINNLLNNKEEKEIVKYRINKEESNLNNFNNENSRTISIDYKYLFNNLNNIVYRIDIRTFENQTSYILNTICGDETNYTIYKSKVIDYNIYESLLKKYKIIREEKTKELSFIYDYKKYKVVFNEFDEITLEIEKSNFINDIKIPPYIKIYDNLEKKLKYDNIK